MFLPPCLSVLLTKCCPRTPAHLALGQVVRPQNQRHRPDFRKLHPGEVDQEVDRGLWALRENPDQPLVCVWWWGGCYPAATGSSITKVLWVCFGRDWKWEASGGVD